VVVNTQNNNNVEKVGGMRVRRERRELLRAYNSLITCDLRK
jgi:hypothetical protein